MVAAVQMRSALGRTEENLDRLESLVHRAADDGAKIVVTPECSIHGYAADDLRTIWHASGRRVNPRFRLRPVGDIGERIPGPSTARLGEIAKRRRIWLLGGLIEHGAAGGFYNAAVLLSHDGDVVAKHRKRWPWPAIEPAWATAGDTPPVRCQTPWGTVGIAICYDIHRVRRLYGRRDLWTLLFPAAWIDDDSPAKYFDRRFPLAARRLDSNLVFANHSLPDSTRWQGSGASTIYLADGSIAARSQTEFGDDVVIAELPAAC